MPRKRQLSPKISHHVVFSNPRRYLAFPDICRIGDSLFGVVFREAPVRKRGYTHIDPHARVALLTSRDVAKWNPESRVEIPGSRGAAQLPVLTPLAPGRLLLTDFKWRVGNSLRNAEYKIEALGSLGRYASFDSARTIEFTLGKNKIAAGPPRKIEVDSYSRISNSLCVINGPGDSLLMPVDAERAITETWSVLLLKSSDRGKSWPLHGVIASSPVPGTLRLCEPALLTAASGKMICVTRSFSEDDLLYQCDSADGGKTWSFPEPLDIVGHPAHLLQLRDGRVLMLFGHRHEPYGIRAALSRDEGKTWSAPITIRDDGAGPDLGYPRGIELPDGSVAAVYYFRAPEGTRNIQMSIIERI